jgi:SagB-type dehydrogenase family enzyme
MDLDLDLDTFVHDLHFDTDKAKPSDHEADWQDAPLPFKLYRRLPVFPLKLDIPLTFENHLPVSPHLDHVGYFLWYSYGLSQVSHSVYETDFSTHSGDPLLMNRRIVSSGGALYPNELYIYLKLKDLPDGVYHYDVLHHRLVLLREGNYDSYLEQALGHRCDLTKCFGAVLVSTMFWKNFFKYHNFSYRLQGLDAGVMMGQLLETAKRFGYSAAVYFQYLDRPVNHLLGIHEQEESVYAVIPLSELPAENWFKSGNDRNVMASELLRELPELHHEHYLRSKKVMEYPWLIRMNEASMMQTSVSFRHIQTQRKALSTTSSVDLPEVKRVTYDFAETSRNRYSLETEFVLREVSPEMLGSLLQEALSLFSYVNDLDNGRSAAGRRVSLYGCFYRVAGIPDGAYRYEPEDHRLIALRPGDLRGWLQQGMTLHNVNLFQVPLCMHAAGDVEHLRSELGYRGYRIQQMEAGMMAQRLLLAASALGMGGRPLLGFEASTTDEIYKMGPQGETCLIQIPVGPYRSRCRLEGSFHY